MRVISLTIITSGDSYQNMANSNNYTIYVIRETKLQLETFNPETMEKIHRFAKYCILWDFRNYGHIRKYRPEDGNPRPVQTKKHVGQFIHKILMCHWMKNEHEIPIIILTSIAEPNMNRIRLILWTVEW